MRVAYGQTPPAGADFAAYTVEKQSPSGRTYTAVKPGKRAAMLATLGFLNLTGEVEKFEGVEIYETALGGSGAAASDFVASKEAPILAVVALAGSQAILLAFGERVDQVLRVLETNSAVEEAVFLRDQERTSNVIPVVVGLTVAAAAVGGVMYLGRRR